MRIKQIPSNGAWPAIRLSAPLCSRGSLPREKRCPTYVALLGLAHCYLLVSTPWAPGEEVSCPWKKGHPKVHSDATAIILCYVRNWFVKGSRWTEPRVVGRLHTATKASRWAAVVYQMAQLVSGSPFREPPGWRSGQSASNKELRFSRWFNKIKTNQRWETTSKKARIAGIFGRVLGGESCQRQDFTQKRRLATWRAALADSEPQ